MKKKSFRIMPLVVVCGSESSIVQPKAAECVDVAGNRYWWVCCEFVAAAVIVTVQFFSVGM